MMSRRLSLADDYHPAFPFSQLAADFALSARVSCFSYTAPQHGCELLLNPLLQSRVVGVFAAFSTAVAADIRRYLKI